MVICFALLVYSFRGSAQTTPIVWEAESIKDLRSNEENLYSCLFKIQDDRVDWIQGDFVQSFTVKSVEGVLPESGNGKVTYNVKGGNKDGRIVVERAGEVTFLEMDLRKDAVLGAYYRFKVVLP